MARCIPYVPRRVRDPVAVAMALAAPEPAAAPDKLQKEREIMQKKEKKERKEEKKRQKKAAKLGEKYEISDHHHHHHSKHGRKKRKHEGQNIAAAETRKDSKDTVEHLEKSGLSEEHDAPSCRQAWHDTPESSLDSNKRPRVTVSPSPSQTRNAVFRVKLASAVQIRGPESTAVLSGKPISLEQQSVKQMGLDLSMAKGQSKFQPHTNEVVAPRQLVASDQKIGLKNCSQPSEFRQVNQQRVNMVPRASPQPTPKANQRVGPQPTKVLRSAEPTPVKVMQRAGQPMPSRLFQKDIPQVPANKSMKAAACADPPGNVELPAVLQKPKTIVELPVGKQQPQPDALPKEDLRSVRTNQKMALRDVNQLGESTQINHQQHAMAMQRVNMVPRVSPQPTPKVLQRVDPPVRNVQQRVNVERDTPQVPVNLLKKATTAAPHGQPGVEQPALLHKPMVPLEPPVVNQQQQIVALPEDHLCSIGTTSLPASAKQVQRPSSDRKSRKAEKKEREFADLSVTWKPSPIQMEDDMDVGDQDWLFSRGATPRSNCVPFDGSVRCRPAEQLFSMQPRAVHLPDLHMYQLPYVVPF